MKFLLDTCLLSELRKKLPNSGVINWVATIAEERFYLSVITLGEIQKGISCLPASPKRDQLQTWLDQDLQNRFASRILSIDLDTSLEWGILSGDGAKTGAIPPVVDSLIAATAIRHNLTLVTRNVEDFTNLPVRILNPWD